MTVGRAGAMLAIALAMLPQAATAQRLSSSDLVYGRTVAERACARCHQVQPDQQRPPAVVDQRTGARVAAPTFAAIANDPQKGAAYLRAFLKMPHYPMPDQSLPSGDIPYLTGYIASLRGSHR